MQACGQQGPAVGIYFPWPRTILLGSSGGAGRREAATRGKGKAGPAAPITVAAAGHQGLGTAQAVPAAQPQPESLGNKNTQLLVPKREPRPRTDILHCIKPIHVFCSFHFLYQSRSNLPCVITSHLSSRHLPVFQCKKRIKTPWDCLGATEFTSCPPIPSIELLPCLLSTDSP